MSKRLQKYHVQLKLHGVFSIHCLKMSKRLQKYHVQLKLLKEASAIMRKEILKNCNKYLLCCLCECVQNLFKGNVPVTEAQKTKLARFKTKLREFATKKTLVAVKRKLAQTGASAFCLLLCFPSWGRYQHLSFRMEHANKMVLVEPRQIENYNETPLDKVRSKLDGQIYDIPHKDIPDDEKAELYSASLNSYLDINKPTFLTKFESTAKESKESEHANYLTFFKSILLESRMCMSTTLGFLEVYQSNMLGQIIIGFLLHARVLRYGMVFPLLLKKATAFCQFKRLWCKYARSDQFV